MQTIRLIVNDKLHKNLIRLLSKFSREEIHVIEENDTFLSVQKYIEKELVRVEYGIAKYLSIYELDNSLGATIYIYET